MSKGIKTVLKIFGVLIAAVLVFAIVLIGWLTITEFKPEPEKTVPVEINECLEPKKDVLGKTLRVLTFNIGYGNLGKESDFFMDGGENVRNGDKELVLKNLEGVLNEIKNADADIILIQEVDRGSARSFKTAQFGKIKEEMEGFRAAWAANYICDFVPFPWPPIGSVNSGIVTLSELDMTVGNRISLPCPFKWPVSAANLKRCLLVTYTDIEGTDKQLVTVNLHLEAYDDGEGKIAQTKMLWEVLESEYAKGNYVIAGGDFNQTFPGAVGKY
ncbi:MAG: endonuclease, partial [Oscillospiraceae bacterium]|nr:endonuclease [Oscillospiraceae bacterium]